jgi:hypothetical protein
MLNDIWPAGMSSGNRPNDRDHYLLACSTASSAVPCQKSIDREFTVNGFLANDSVLRPAETRKKNGSEQSEPSGVTQ